MSKFNRFPKSFHFNYNNICIEFKQSSSSLSFWSDSQKRLMDLFDIIYISLHIEGCNDHSRIWTHDEIKKVASNYAEKHFCIKE